MSDAIAVILSAIVVLVIILVWHVGKTVAPKPDPLDFPTAQLIIMLQELSILYYGTLTGMQNGSIRQAALIIYEVMGQTAAWSDNATLYKQSNDVLMAQASAFKLLQNTFNTYTLATDPSVFVTQGGAVKQFQLEFQDFLLPAFQQYVQFWETNKTLVNDGAGKEAGDKAAGVIQAQMGRAANILGGLAWANGILVAQSGGG